MLSLAPAGRGGPYSRLLGHRTNPQYGSEAIRAAGAEHRVFKLISLTRYL